MEKNMTILCLNAQFSKEEHLKKLFPIIKTGQTVDISTFKEEGMME